MSKKHRIVPIAVLLACALSSSSLAQDSTSPKAPPAAPAPTAPAAAEPQKPAPRPDTPDEAKARAEIRMLLDEMTKRVLATDVEGYLGLIDRTDLCFANEQKYWANELKKFPAAEFSLALGDNITLSPTGAKADLTMKWAVKDKDGTVRKARDITYTVCFTHSGQSWKYAGEAWLEHGGEGVLVKYEDESLKELAEGIAKVFPSVRAHVEEGFTIKVPRVQQVKLYTSMKHLQAGICLSYKDGLGGWNEPGESIRQLVRRGQTGEGSRVVLAHEFGHVCTFELGPKSNEMPWWVLEGVAELSAEEAAHSSERNHKEIESMARRGVLVPWKDLATWGEVSDANYGKVYSQGHHMLGFISDTFGRDKRVAWLKAMATGSSIDAATTSTLGLSFDELDAKWRAGLPEKGAEPPVDAKPTPDKSGS